MPCTRPLKGYRSKDLNPSGKRSMVFNPSQGYKDRPLQTRCGVCIDCRLNHSRQWAIRMMHEASLHSDNIFLTLTYSPQNLPPTNSLHLPHFQNFLKKLRKHAYPKKIRFYHCGEYGDDHLRPHYHSIIFGFDFVDKKLHTTRNGEKVFRSETLEKLWTHGFSEIGSVTFESAAYVARYITKKVKGREAANYYTWIDEDTGEIYRDIRPEYATMSRRPGIGRPWFDKFKNDAFPSDQISMRGKLLPAPRAYTIWLESIDADMHAKILAKRQNLAKLHPEEKTWDRLLVKEQLQEIKLAQLPRKL